MENYQQPPAHPGNNGYGYNPGQEVSPVISVKEWMLMTLVMIIPIVNIIMMFVWAFGEGNPTKKNYFKASLLWAAIIIAIYAVVFIIIIAAAASTSFS
jgi:uncharacterized integral membrane protein